ncbi:hypothetical protein BD289DRAFT_101064 [Coniella lustricola]|uniref:Zn(2)-C6 fungal-type domain-containing protein n=1 Tax=Coniella lustricola TaxID=2025994 RepID=A0A2T3AGQ2_9PEZI|nr:hypothetical protein BD289DRAFT_101064 [Coniella lustricola]
MDKGSATAKVEAVAEDIAMETGSQREEPSADFHSHNIEEAQASFFPEEQELNTSQQPEPPTPPQRARPDVAAEDLQLGNHGDDQLQQLQLAAQMSQALQGVVGGSAATENDSYKDQQTPDLDDLHQLQDEQIDPDTHRREHSLPESQDLPEVSSENMQPGVSQDLHHTLQQVMQLAAVRQEPHQSHSAHQIPMPQYMSTPPSPPPPPPPPLPQPANIAPNLPVGGTQSQYALGDTTPPRKRSKVSRACDECRRKKVKCDSASETGDEACSNCRRSNVRCMFSRVPQKRGPSKGYIKELADRINSIEGKLGSQTVAEALTGELLSRSNLADSYSAPPQTEDMRKRPYSQVSNNNFASPAPQRPSGWSAEPQPRPVIPPQPSYSANGLALKPILPRGSINMPHATAPEPDVRPRAVALVPNLEENVYHAYLNVIHHVLPFLPSSRDAMSSRLVQCSMTLQNAFIEALNSTMKSFAAVENVPGRLVFANRLLAEFDGEGGRHNSVSDIVYLQCLILMIINVDNLGTISLSREHEGPAKASLLGRAAGQAYAMGVPHEAMTATFASSDETDQCVRVRAWWTLVVLDRWNAISTSTPLIISADAIVLPHNLKPILGEANYRFTLLAYIMGHWTPASVTAPPHSTPGAGARASAIFHLNMEMWRTHFPSDIPPNVEPVLHLSYWHCRLLAFLFMPSALITDVTWAVRESVRLLTSHPQMISPLNHHFTALTTLCLIEMTKAEKSREEATQLLSNLLDANIAPSAWDESIRAKIRDALRSSMNGSVEATASQSLQHLADLATATTNELLGGGAAAVATATAGGNGAVIDGGPNNGSSNNGSDSETNIGPPAIGTEVATAGDRAEEEEPRFRTSDNYEDLGFDPRPLLHAGYLNAIAQLPC